MRSLALAIPVLLAVTGETAAQDVDQLFEGGRSEYLAACAACHGENADGNGPIAGMFKTRVPDLRKLSAQNDGVFPLLDTFHIVDGRTQIRGHGDPMPVFGGRYKAELAGEIGAYAAEPIIRARVLELVFYLQSIQE